MDQQLLTIVGFSLDLPCTETIIYLRRTHLSEFCHVSCRAVVFHIASWNFQVLLIFYFADKRLLQCQRFYSLVPVHYIAGIKTFNKV